MPKHAAPDSGRLRAQFKKYENQPQPKITAVDTRIDIDPARRSFSGSAHYTLQNKTSRAHFRNSHHRPTQSVSQRPIRPALSPGQLKPRDIYSIYALDQPLAPGELRDDLQRRVSVPWFPRRQREGRSSPTTALSSTPVTSLPLATIRVSSSMIRAAAGKSISARWRNCAARRSSAIALQPFHAKTPTGSPITPLSALLADQIAIAPGYLQREWQENGRNFFEYSMGSTDIADFFAFSRRATMSNATDTTAPILRCTTPLATNSTLTTCWPHPRPVSTITSANYSPYQFAQFRIMEFPRYREFRTVFP